MPLFSGQKAEPSPQPWTDCTVVFIYNEYRLSCVFKKKKEKSHDMSADGAEITSDFPVFVSRVYRPDITTKLCHEPRAG